MKKLISIFQSGRDTISSKRVCGVLGWIDVLICAFMGKDVPYMDVLIGACVVLLGVETVTNAFSKAKTTDTATND